MGPLTIRSPGEENIRAARSAVKILRPNDSFITDYGKQDLPVIRLLTPKMDLHQEFPRVIDGTLYAYFERWTPAQSPIVLFIHQDPMSIVEQAHYEIALAMLDNIHFH